MGKLPLLLSLLLPHLALCHRILFVLFTLPNPPYHLPKSNRARPANHLLPAALYNLLSRSLSHPPHLLNLCDLLPTVIPRFRSQRLRTATLSCTAHPIFMCAPRIDEVKALTRCGEGPARPR